MSEGPVNSWQRAWTIKEIIDNASNWSLAGDAGLLKYLESYSEDLLAKAQETNNNLDAVVNKLDDASLSLEEIKNSFRSLRNTQFIESRVYEDDETASETKEESNQEKDSAKSHSSMVKDMKEAAEAGIENIYKFFKVMQFASSDSEDEKSDMGRFVLKPIDPYAHRPLPYLIGSEEWHKKWHVGLLDSSSESDQDKISEKFSDSDSEIDFGNKSDIINLDHHSNSDQPVANSTFDERIKPDLFHSSDNSTASYLAANNNFTNELAKTLDSLVENCNNEEAVNRRPINTATHIRDFGNLYSDEPPPIDEIIDNNNVRGLFSGGQGLFDDVDDNVNLWNEGKKIKTEKLKPKVSNLFEDDLENDLFNDENLYEKDTPRGNNIIKSKIGGLFDDEDDILFNNNIPSNAEANYSYLQSNTTMAIPFIADEPPEIKPKPVEKEETTTKKPIGGVKIMENSDLGSFLKQRRLNSSNSGDEPEQDLETEKKNSNMEDLPVTKNLLEKKTLSLFDDDDDDEDQAIFEKDLFATPYTREEVKVEEGIEKSVSEPKSINNAEKSQNETISYAKHETTLFEDKISEPTERQIKNDKIISLFDDDDKSDESLSDSLFATPKRKINENANKSESKNEHNIPPLFDINPPELDDNWDSRLENNLFDDNLGLFDNIPEMSSRRSGLFDSEPPSLFFESSGIIRDISTRVGNDESFSPHASSSRRFSSDIFNEQQSNDSFFVTKNKSHVDTHSTLHIIPEVASEITQSSFEITPSGKEDELFTESSVGVPESVDLRDEKSHGDSKQEDEVADKSEKFVPQDSPGKLKHNLKINVNALMPGASPPKKKPVEQAPSLEIPTSDEESVKQLSLKSTDYNKTTEENFFKGAEVLPSVTKDRVRIPVKRRPSTRKGRQEFLRKSIPDLEIISNDFNTAEKEDQTKPANIPKSKSREFVDIFAEVIAEPVEEMKPEPLFLKKTDLDLNQEEINKKAEPNRPIINSESFETEDYKQINLFDEAEEFDDIFSSKKLPPKSNILSRSLFDNEFDDEDDDDIFGEASFKQNVSKSNMEQKPVQKKPLLTTQVKKLENSKVVEDPLSSFLDE
ncbi:hypothetical protein FQA39_LY16110 [Lamprigera yunnana]|nr:hypothetical protein FQA39_LY16110 [Lamprigera yunnana]